MPQRKPLQSEPPHRSLEPDALPSLVPSANPLLDDAAGQAKDDELLKVPLSLHLYRLAAALHRKGDGENCEVLLRHALRVDEGHGLSRLLLGVVLLERGRLDESIAELERLLGDDPELGRAALPRALLARGQQLEEAGREDEALEVYERVLSLSPAHDGALARRQGIWRQRGEAALDRGEPEPAIAAFQKAQAEDRVTAAKALLRVQRLDRAEAEAAQHAWKEEWAEAAGRYAYLVEQLPDVPRFREGLARAEAELALRRHYDEGSAALRSGELPKAVRALSLVVAERPELLDAADLLGEAAARLRGRPVLERQPRPQPERQPDRAERTEERSERQADATTFFRHAPADEAMEERGASGDTPVSLPRSPGTGRAIALALACAGAGALVGAALRRPPPAPPVVAAAAQAPRPEVTAAELLLQAEVEMGRRQWERAIALSQRAAATVGVGPQVQAAAQSCKERAERQKRAEQAYLRFLYQVGAGDHPEQLVPRYQEIPLDSIYRELAGSSYRSAVTPLFKGHLAHAETARAAGRCYEFRYWLYEAKAVLPDDPQLQEKEARRCYPQGAERGR